MTHYAIDFAGKVELGGLRQKIHIRGTEPSNPVLLFLHGGPGVPNRHHIMTGLAGLARRFTIVAWDQRGTGGSAFGVSTDTITLERYVEDAHELVEHLCARLGKDKLFICGHSWGSELGVSLVKAHPERIAAYVGCGQVVHGHRNEALSYEYVLRKAEEAGNAKDVAALRDLGAPVDGCYNPVFDGLLRQRALLSKYGGSSFARQGLWESTVRPLLFSREMTLADKIGTIKGYKRSLKLMWPLIVGCDLLRDARQLPVPVYLFHGAHDYTTPIPLAEEYYAVLQAPRKELIRFERSAHDPMNEEPERFRALIVEKLLGARPGSTPS